MSIQFDRALSQYVDFGPTSTLNDAPGGTICVWIQALAGVGTEDQIYFNSIGTDANLSRLNLSRRRDINRWRISARQLDSEVLSQNVDGTSPVVDGSIYFVCGVANYAGGSLSVYVNGLLETTLAVPIWTGNTSPTNSLSVVYGARTGGVNATSGILDDARVYRRLLTATEIGNLYAARGRDSNVFQGRARLPLNEQPPGVVSATVYNKFGLNGTGTPVNAPVYRVEAIAFRRRRR